MARKWILKVAKYPFERAVFGHGKPLNKRANAMLKEKFENAGVPWRLFVLQFRLKSFLITNGTFKTAFAAPKSTRLSAVEP